MQVNASTPDVNVNVNAFDYTFSIPLPPGKVTNSDVLERISVLTSFGSEPSMRAFHALMPGPPDVLAGFKGDR